MRREQLTYWYLKDRVGYMEIIKDGDNVAQKAYQHLAAKEKTT